MEFLWEDDLNEWWLLLTSERLELLQGENRLEGKYLKQNLSKWADILTTHRSVIVCEISHFGGTFRETCRFNPLSSILDPKWMESHTGSVDILKHSNIFDGYPNDVDDVDEAHLDATPIWQPRKAEVPSEQSQFGSGSRFGLKAGQGGVKLTAEREG